MLQEVARADVVITDSRVAVAILYRPLGGAGGRQHRRPTMSAPLLVAGGENRPAQRIRELAMENGVAVVERPTLARDLYRAVEPGREIRRESSQAVAEALAYASQLAGRRPPAARRQPSLEAT